MPFAVSRCHRLACRVFLSSNIPMRSINESLFTKPANTLVSSVYIMFQIIHIYAGRNQAFHRGLGDALKSQKFTKTAKWILPNIEAMSSLVPLDWLAQENTMRAAQEVLKAEWFDDSYAPDESERWIAKQTLLESSLGLKKGKIKKNQSWERSPTNDSRDSSRPCGSSR